MILHELEINSKNGRTDSGWEHCWCKHIHKVQLHIMFYIHKNMFIVLWMHNYEEFCLLTFIVWLGLSDVEYLEYVCCNLLMVLSPSQWSHWSKVNIIPLTVPRWPGQCFDQFLPGFQFRHSGGQPGWNWPSQHLERSQSHHELLRAFLSVRSAGGEEIPGQSWWRRQWSGKWLVGPS